MNYHIEAFLVLAFFYLFYYFFLQKDKMFNRNRFYLLFTAVFAVILPTWEFSMWESPFSNVSLPVIEITTKQKKAEIENIQMSVFQTIIIVYWLVVVLLLIRFLFHLYLIFQKIATLPQQHKRGYVLIETNGTCQTFSFFHYIFWNNSEHLTEEEIDLILYHEQRHIWDKHTIDILAIELLKIFFWYNPFVYLYAKSLRLQHEYIADRGVLRETSAQNYGHLLLKNLAQTLKIPFAHSFNQSAIKQRLLMMKNTATKNYFWQKMLAIISFMVCFCWLLAGKNIIQEQNRFLAVEGGLDKFYEEFKKVFKQPTHQAKGKIYVIFTVNPDGTTSNFKITKNINLDKDYQKAVLEALPKVNAKWIPPKSNGKNVKQQISLPLHFNIQ
jgi:beta-lactamase regulating signal transducer with metallopeptidase domain